MALHDSSSAQRAYALTKEQILAGELRGGQLLSEVEVAGRLGVSRTPVHEAFLRLAAEDLLDLQPRRGAVVVPVDPGDAVDVLEMRLALETAAVRRLCHDPDAVARLSAELEDLVEEQRRSAGDATAFAAADAAFHRRIVDHAGNALARRFYGALHDRQRLMLNAVAADADRHARLVDEHGRLAEAIDRRDLPTFEALLVAHLETTYRVHLR